MKNKQLVQGLKKYVVLTERMILLSFNRSETEIELFIKIA